MWGSVSFDATFRLDQMATILAAAEGDRTGG
jgi:hypothetical protein